MALLCSGFGLRSVALSIAVIVGGAGCTSATAPRPKGAPAGFASPSTPKARADLVAPIAPLEIAASKPAADVARLALLVGVENYSADTPNDMGRLTGPTNDVRSMRRLLEDRYGFDPANVRTLIDEQASFEGFLRAFEELLAQAESHSECLIYFTGHGSRVPDESTDASREHDGLDSSYLLWDSRAYGAEGQHDLTDDLLGSLVAALAHKSAFVTVVTDACHSGDGLRGRSRNAVRSAPAGTRPRDLDWVLEFWPAGVAIQDDITLARLQSAPVAHLAACRADEEAYEIELDTAIGLDEPHGAFTFALCRVLEQRGGELTWRQVAESTRARLATLQPAQTATARGELDRHVFGESFRPLPGCPAWINTRGDVVLDEGWMSGLRSGSVLEMRDASGNKVVGRARVVWTGPARARAKWIEGPQPLAKGERGALRALEVERPQGLEPLRVQVEDESLRALLTGSPLITLLDRPPKNGEYRLFLSADRTPCISDAEGVLARRGSALAAQEEPSRAILESLVTDVLRWRGLWTLGLQPGVLQVALSVRPATAAECAEVKPPAGAPGSACAPAVHNDQRDVWQAADATPATLPLVMIEVTNPLPERVYVTILSIPEDRSINVIVESSVIESGGSSGWLVGLLVPDEWSLPRPMRDRYVALVTREAVVVRAYEQSPTLRSKSDVPEVLRPLIDGNALRGDGSFKPSPDSYGVSVLDLLVERKK